MVFPLSRLRAVVDPCIGGVGVELPVCSILGLVTVETLLSFVTPVVSVGGDIVLGPLGGRVVGPKNHILVHV